MIYGIPNFKLEKEVVQRRAKLLRDGGVHFHLELRGRPRRRAWPSCARATTPC